MQTNEIKKIVGSLSKTLKTKFVKVIRIEYNRYDDKEFEITLNINNKSKEQKNHVQRQS